MLLKHRMQHSLITLEVTLKHQSSASVFKWWLPDVKWEIISRTGTQSLPLGGQVTEAVESHQVTFPCLLCITSSVSCFRKRESKQGCAAKPQSIQIRLPSNITTWTSHKKNMLQSNRFFSGTVAVLQLPNYTLQECLLCCSLLTDWVTACLVVFLFPSPRINTRREEIWKKRTGISGGNQWE